MTPATTGLRRTATRAIILATATLLVSEQAFPQTVVDVRTDMVLAYDYLRPPNKIVVHEACTLTIPEGLTLEVYGLETYGGTIILEPHSRVILHGPPDTEGTLDGVLLLRPDASGLITGRLDAYMATIKGREIGVGPGSSVKIEHSWLEGTSIIAAKDTKLELRHNQFAFKADGSLQRIETSGTIHLIENDINPGGAIIGGINIAGADTAHVIGNSLRDGSIRAGNAEGTIQIIQENDLRDSGALLFNNVRFEANRLDSSNISVWPGYGLVHYRDLRGSNVSIIDNEIHDPPSFQMAPYYAITIDSMDGVDVSGNTILGQVAERPDVRTKGISWSESTGRIYRNLFSHLKISDLGSFLHDGQVIEVRNQADLGTVEIRENVIQYSGLSDLAANPKSFSLVALEAPVHFVGNHIRDNRLYGYESHYRFEPMVSVDDESSFGHSIVLEENQFVGNVFSTPSPDTKHGVKGKLLSIKLSSGPVEVSKNVFWGDHQTLALTMEAELPDGLERDSVKVHDNYFFQNWIGAWITGAPDFSGNNSFSENPQYHIGRGGIQTDPMMARNNYWGESDAAAIDALLYDDDESYSLALIDFEDYDTDELLLSEPQIADNMLTVGGTTEMTINVASTSGGPAVNKTIHIMVSDPSVARVTPNAARTDVAGDVKAVLEALGVGDFDVTARSTGYASTSAAVNVQPVGVEESVPREVQRDNVVLRANYPNPFRIATTISYSLQRSEEVTLTVYDVLGRRIDVLYSGPRPPGEYAARFDASNLAAGIYFCRLTAGSQSRVSTLVVAR